MILAYIVMLGLTTQKTSDGAQKIDDSPLKTYGMASAKFLLQNSLRKIWFFKETFILADTNIKVVLRMPFLFLGNIDVKCTEKP